MDGMAPTEVISSTIPDASVTAAGTANNINTTHQTKQPPPRKSSVVFYWFRLGDLRLSDNQGLTHAAKLAAPPKPKKIKTDKSKKGKAKINKLPPDAAALWSAIHQSDGLSLMSRPQDDAALKNTLQTDIQIIDSSTTTIVDEPSGKDAKAAAASALVPIFCFEPGIFGANALSRDWKHLRCHARRAQFIVESVADLREQWQKRQPTKQENTSAAASDDDDDAVPPLVSPFLVAHGEPAEIFDQLLHQLRTAAGGDEFLNVRIVCQDEPAFEERAAVESVSRVLKKHMAREASSCSDGDEENVPVATEAEVKAIWGSYLFSGKGLTNGARSKINPSSDLLSRFTIDVNKKHKTKDLKLLPSPDFNPTPIPVKSPMIEAMATFMPTLQDLGYTQEQILAARVDRRAAMIFPGGETAAMARIHDYIWVQKNLRDFGETRFGLIGQEYSSKFSPWLSHGCVSPRFIALEVKKHARLNRKFHESCCYISKVPLVQRDFCRYYTARHGNEIFQLNGPLVRKKLLKNKSTFAKPLSKKAIWKATSPTPMPHSETERFTAWTDGQTGYPFIDACMRELKYTGYMSLRGRMNVASFLVFDLKVDWRRGAEWFEYQLIDYEVCSNWVVSFQCIDMHILIYTNIVYSQIFSTAPWNRIGWLPQVCPVRSRVAMMLYTKAFCSIRMKNSSAVGYPNFAISRRSLSICLG